MFEFFRKKCGLNSDEIAADDARKQNLRPRLHATLDLLVETLIRNHGLADDTADRVKVRAERIRQGIDLVMRQGLYAYDKKIPEDFRGGATIAQSADAFSSLSISLNEPDLEPLIGSAEDKETVGHICYQLGFSRDGSFMREV